LPPFLPLLIRLFFPTAMLLSVTGEGGGGKTGGFCGSQNHPFGFW
jgi:hypothetical protein